MLSSEAVIIFSFEKQTATAPVQLYNAILYRALLSNIICLKYCGQQTQPTLFSVQSCSYQYWDKVWDEVAEMPTTEAVLLF